MVVLPPAVVLAALAALIEPARTGLLVALAAVVIVGAGYLIVMPQWRYRVHRWETTADAVYIASGWIWQEWHAAPMTRIQTVDTVRGPLQQLFRLAGVTVTTASAAGAITIQGLDRQVAADLALQLTEITQATPGDAT
ncbi:hypothetical protein GCM10009765_40550 [Fodinicola feengrottensis]|uniref:YdbS-like PH domain-containing protein n=1 Tax=Fodinicola feengrottensis TaxID=435914 RepID=A0ABN2HF70_9ACTN